MSQLEYDPENLPISRQAIPNHLSPIAETLIKSSNGQEKSEAEIIAESVVTAVESDTKAMSEHYKLMKVARLVAEKCLMQQNVAETTKGEAND